jgi:hypothetical protein
MSTEFCCCNPFLKNSHFKAEKEMENNTEWIVKKNVFTNWTEMADDRVWW